PQVGDGRLEIAREGEGMTVIAMAAAPALFRIGKALAWMAAGVVVLLLVGVTGTESDFPMLRLDRAPLPAIFVTQPFGCTSLALEPVDHDCAGGHFHSGVDLAAPAGTPVRAVGGGTAVVVKDAAGYGLHVTVTEAG